MKKTLSLLLLLVLLFVAPSFSSSPFSLSSSNVTDLLLPSLERNDFERRPKFGGPPVQVGVTMYIINVGSISEEDMEFTTTFYFRQYWHDDRLSLVNASSSSSSPADESGGKNEVLLLVPPSLVSRVWTPDTFFANDKRSDATGNSFLRFSPTTGRVSYSTRLTVTSSCFMKFYFFPLDTQKCSLVIESYGFSSKDVVYSWEQGLDSFGISDEVEVTLYQLTGHRMKTSVLNFNTGEVFSRLQCDFILERSRGFYLLHYYLPSALFVVVAWLTFWQKHHSNPARTGAAVVALLCSVLLFVSGCRLPPRVSVVKALDVYLGVCSALAVVSLVVTLYVEYVEKEGCRALVYFYPRNVDKYFRVGFLVFFLVFNVAYWALYLGLNEPSSFVIPYKR